MFRLTLILWFSLPLASSAQLFGLLSSRYNHRIGLIDRVDLPTDAACSGTVASWSSFLECFGDTTNYSLPRIDFERQELRLESTCHQCEVVCPDPTDPCHRNACDYQSDWYLYSKEPVRVPFQRRFLDDSHFFGSTVIINSDSAARALAVHPEIIATINWDSTVLLGRVEGGDCHATFGQSVAMYHSKRAVIWETTVNYGGCRAGGTWDFWITIPRPPEGYAILFETSRIKERY